jgi:hypothetical protein
MDASTAETPTPIVIIQDCPTVETSQETDVSARLPFEGMWISTSQTDPKLDSQIIVFTADSMYMTQNLGIASDQANEKFANIGSYDLENNHIILRTQWIRVNGMFAGFDSPNFSVTYVIENDTLRIGVGWEGEFASEVDPLVYYRK